MTSEGQMVVTQYHKNKTKPTASEYDNISELLVIET